MKTTDHSHQLKMCCNKSNHKGHCLDQGQGHQLDDLLGVDPGQGHHVEMTDIVIGPDVLT